MQYVCKVALLMEDRLSSNSEINYCLATAVVPNAATATVHVYG